MMIRSIRFCLTIVCVAPAVLCAAPRLSSVSPIGFERGKTVTVSIFGDGLDGDIEILSKIPATAKLKPVETPDGKPAYNVSQRRDIELTIAADAPIGIYPLRVRTQDGLSNQVVFSVGLLPDVGEVEPNNLLAQAQPIELGRTIHGGVQPADRDMFKLNLPAGARVVAEVEAKRLGQPMDSFLQMLDSAGHEMASNDDAVGLDSDSRIDVTVSKPGDYFLIVNDVTFQTASAYRLKVGVFDYADAIFPLGGPRAKETRVWPVTVAGRPAEPKVFSTQQAGGWTMVQPMDTATAALPFRFVVGPGDEIMEGENGPTLLAANQTANGRLLQSGERDRFRIAVASGQKWRFQLTAASLGSPLDGVLTLLDSAGNTLARADDGAGLDPSLEYTVPANINEVLAEVSDLQGHGGPAFSYRLTAELLPASDFGLEVVPDVINVPQGSSEVVQVRVERRGYDGPIQLFVPESIPGVIADGGRIEPGENTGYLLVSAAPDAAPGRLNLEIWGRGGPEAHPMDRKARGSPANIQPWMDAGLIDPMPAAVSRAKPLGAAIQAKTVTVVHGYKGTLEIAIQRGEGVTEDVRIVPRVRTRSFPQGLEITIPKDKSSATLEFPGGTEVPLGKGVMVFEAITNVAGREVHVTLPPVNVRVVRPFSIEVLKNQLTLPPTGSGTVDVLVRRVAPFNQPVVVRVDDLPKGVACEPITLAAGESTGRLAIKSEAAPAGQFTLKVIPAADIPGRKRDKDYVLAPTEVKLTIAQ